MIIFPINALAALSQSQALFLSVQMAAAQHRTQRAKATNQNVVTGNLGVVTTGVQTANPINVGPS